MDSEQPRALTSRDFGADSFQHTVLSLRERCLKGEADAQQIGDWRKLSDWIGCGDGPFTTVHADRLKTARIAFLRAASDSPFEAAMLPPSEIREIFERLSPAGIAIARLQSKGKGKEEVPAKGIGRQNGSLVGGLIVFGLIVAIAMRKGAPDAEAMGELMGHAFVPAFVAALVASLWQGGPDFRPLKDALVVALVGGGLEALSEMGAYTTSSSVSVGPAIAGIIFVLLTPPIWILTALVTWVSNSLVARKKTGGRASAARDV